MSTDYWTSREAEQRVYGIPHGTLWRLYEAIRYGRVSQSVRAEVVLDSLSVEEVLSKFGVKAQKGSSYWTITCPNPKHEDRHPSCVVWTRIKRFKCYSCGFSGDLLDLYRFLKESGEGDLDGE